MDRMRIIIRLHIWGNGGPEVVFILCACDFAVNGWEVRVLLPTGDQVAWLEGCFLGPRGGEQGEERHQQGVRAAMGKLCLRRGVVSSRGAQVWGPEVGIQERRNAGEGK